MIERAWFESQKGLIIDYFDGKFLDCHFDKRAIYLCVNEFSDGTSSTSIHFIENDITLFRAEIEGLQTEVVKELLAEWLIHKISHNRLAERRDEIVKDGIYEAYLRGEDAMLDYHWQQAEENFQQVTKHTLHEKKENLVEVLDLCRRSSILKRFVPFISVGRLCISKTRVFEPHRNDSLCFNYIRNKFEVADYEHNGVRLFDNAKEAVQYVEEHYKLFN